MLATRWIPFLLGVSWFGLTAVESAEPVNLFSNGGFEEGLSGWTPQPIHSIADEREVAHSGKACLTATISGTNQAATLTRRAPVKAGNRYRLELWARATNKTRLALWAILPGMKRKQSLGAFDGVPAKWKKFSVPVDVGQDGTLELQVVGPSSYGAPAGQMWIDDIALYETVMPALVPVSRDEGFNDEAAAAAGPDGSVYAAWISFRDGADSIQLGRYRLEDKEFQRQGQWQVAGGPKTYVLGLRAVASADGVTLVYANEENGNWDIVAVPCTEEGPGKPIRVSTDEAVDAQPAAAWHEGALHIAWESNRNGRHQVFAATVRDGKASEPVAVSDGEDSDYDPSLAVLESGEVCVAWHGFRDGNYDISLRRQSPSGEWGDMQRLTKAPTVDRHPVLFSRGDELWLVYENAQTEKYNISRTNRRRLYVVRVDGDGLKMPKCEGPPPFAGRCEAGFAAFDEAGRLWLSFLKPRLPRAGWDAVVTCYADGRWITPEPLAGMKSFDRQVPLIVGDGRVIAAFQADNTPTTWSEVDKTMAATSNIHLAVINPPDLPAGGAISTEALIESEEPFEPAEIRVARGEELATPSIEYQGEQLNLYFGDLHEHSDVSVCNRVGDQSIEESYQHMRDIVRHDFACVTDHGYNINPYLWGWIAKNARVQNDPGRYLTFLGEEWTSSFEEYSEEHPYGFYGHRNLVFADPYFPTWFNSKNRQTPAQLWEDLRKLDANFVNIPHQLADTGNVPTDWNFADEEAQPVAEILQTRGSYEYKGAPREAPRSTPEPGYFLQDAWARGIVIGVIASPDHGGGYGKACVYASELTREAILDALRARHCYGTSAAKIVLDVRVDGHLMGEKVKRPAGKSVEVTIHVACPAKIDRVEVCRNNQFIFTKRPDGKDVDLSFVDRNPLPGRSYYYVRVIQEDEEIAWSSPVWFEAE
jgi:Carbohydrate binding domain